MALEVSLSENSLQADDSAFIDKVEILLDQYETAYRKSETKFSTMKKRAESMIFEDNEEVDPEVLAKRRERVGRMESLLHEKKLTNTLEIPDHNWQHSRI